MVATAREAKRSRLLSEIGVSRVLVLALALQSTLLVKATVLGVIPELVFVVIVSLAYFEGERVAIVTGFFGGLLQDLPVPQTIVGLKPLVYVLVAYGVARARHLAPSESVWTPVLAVAIASAVAELGYSTLSILLGQPWVGLSDTGKIAGLVVLYNVLLTPFVFPLVRRLADRYRPERIQRW